MNAQETVGPNMSATSVSACERPEVPVLTHADDNWLQAIRGEAVITDEWLHFANELLEDTGYTTQADPKKLTELEKHCRASFYEDMLGFAWEESPSYQLDEKFFKKQGVHAPPHRFIGAMRIYDREMLDVIKASRDFREGWSLNAQTIEQRFQALKATLGEEETLRLLRGSAGALAKPNFVRRIKAAQEIGGLFGWGPEQVDEVILGKPTLLGSSRRKLLLGFRYLVTFGNEDVTPSQAGNLLIENPDKQMVALDRGASYTHTYIRNATERMSPLQCRREARKILADPDRATQFGEPIIAMHRQYHRLSPTPSSKRPKSGVKSRR